MSLQSSREVEGMICLKIAERQSHNIELGQLPSMLTKVRDKINREEMFVATGNVLHLFR